MQLDSVAVLPLLLSSDAAQEQAPRSTPFSETQRNGCRMNGELEGDARDVSKCRPLVATEPAFVDHHVQAAAASASAGAKAKSVYAVPLTGARLSRMPRYRGLESCTGTLPATEEERREEANAWKETFANDYRECISAGQMHVHTDTCFKYEAGKRVKKAKHSGFTSATSLLSRSARLLTARAASAISFSLALAKISSCPGSPAKSGPRSCRWTHLEIKSL